MKTTQKTIFLLAVLLLGITSMVMAQPTPPGSPADVPIDGGLSLLAAAGAALGAKKAWNARKSAKKAD